VPVAERKGFVDRDLPMRAFGRCQSPVDKARTSKAGYAPTTRGGRRCSPRRAPANSVRFVLHTIWSIDEGGSARLEIGAIFIIVVRRLL
jgi:hypothetical protein